MLSTTVTIGQMERSMVNASSYDRALHLVKPNPVSGKLYFIIVNPGNGYRFASVGENNFIKLIDVLQDE